jgi:hypothetical protein
MKDVFFVLALFVTVLTGCQVTVLFACFFFFNFAAVFVEVSRDVDLCLWCLLLKLKYFKGTLLRFFDMA